MPSFADMLQDAIPAFWHQFMSMIGRLFVENPWVPFMVGGIALLAWLARPRRRARRQSDSVTAW